MEVYQFRLARLLRSEFRITCPWADDLVGMMYRSLRVGHGQLGLLSHERENGIIGPIKSTPQTGSSHSSSRATPRCPSLYIS